MALAGQTVATDDVSSLVLALYRASRELLKAGQWLDEFYYTVSGKC